MLSMRGVSKGFGGIKVLQDVDFFVQEGEVHALLGANGAGKSTLIKVLGGQYSDATGNITISGRPADISSPKAALQSGVSIVHQEFDLVPEMTVAENIFLGFENFSHKMSSRLWQRIDRRSLTQAASTLLNRYRLGIDPNAIVRNLPAGAQQITEIARVIALGNRVMIFDEPTARLGPSDRERLFDVFRTLRQSEKIIVFVTHYLDEVMAIADRASVIRDGKMITTVSTHETTISELSRLMVGENVGRVMKRSQPRLGEPVLLIKSLTDGGAFKEVSFEVAAGEIVGVVGHLGSGRHELTRSIIGLRHVNGTINVRSSANSKAKTGFVPEHRREEGVFAELTIGTNISLGLLRDRFPFTVLPRSEMEKTGLDVIRKLQIKTEGISQKVGQLSGGNQQKTVFGREMVSNPPLYIIEAPTVGVDVKAAVELHNEILNLADRGSGILLATDDLDEAILLSDRILVMLRGSIVREFQAKEISRQDLVTAMGAG